MKMSLRGPTDEIFKIYMPTEKFGSGKSVINALSKVPQILDDKGTNQKSGQILDLVA